MPLRWLRDRDFTKSLMKSNLLYGFAYYLSSFHTLIVLILLSIFFPTIKDFDYVGIWALALSLIEILLIIPSSLGNSLIHKLSHHSLEEKQKSFWALLMLVIRISIAIAVNFVRFSHPIIEFLWGKNFLAHNGSIGSDTILPRLWIVLILSFIKQVYNYIFVSLHLQNKLFWSNLFGVVVGMIIGLPLIYQTGLHGGIITQILLELGFAVGSIFIAWKYKVLPHVDGKFLSLISFCAMISLLLPPFLPPILFTKRIRIATATWLNGIFVIFSYRRLKELAREK